MNNYTGDAIADMIICEYILRHYDWNVQKWYSIYDDRPNSLTKINVPDRDAIETVDSDQLCIRPVGLQNSINVLVEQHGPKARCFVRLSGTENVVRIYAEAGTQDQAESLSSAVVRELRWYLEKSSHQ